MKKKDLINIKTDVISKYFHQKKLRRIKLSCVEDVIP